MTIRPPGKTVTEHRLDELENDVEKMDARIGFVERAIWWALGAGTGVGAMATAIINGVIKKLAA